MGPWVRRQQVLELGLQDLVCRLVWSTNKYQKHKSVELGDQLDFISPKNCEISKS